MSYDVQAIRAQFPALHQQVRGKKQLVYLDNAATTQKPAVVIHAVRDYYERDNANVHRAVHELAERATVAYDAARDTARRFLGARSSSEVVFTRGTTEAINLVAWAWGLDKLRAGDDVLVSAMEHHSNIVPWQLVAARTGARVLPMPVLPDGQLDLPGALALIGPRTRMVSIVHASNALGTINPVRELIDAAHRVGALALVDGAQATPHMSLDLNALGCDFYALSGHKVYGPTGIGLLYGRAEILAQLGPWQGGGDMIETVSFDGTTFAEPPARFEAGTPNIAGAIGLAAALDWLDGVGRDAVAAHEGELLAHGTELLQSIPGLRLIGTAPHKVGVLSFVVDGANSQDVGTLLDMEGVAVRTGHHCAQPAMRAMGVDATIRASLAAYNTHAELDRLAQALKLVLPMLLD